MIDGKLLVEKLVVYAKHFLYLSEYDETYMRNVLLGQFGLVSATDSKVDEKSISKMAVPDELFAEIKQYATENALCEQGFEDIYANYIFGILSPMPSEINHHMRALREKISATAACEYLYELGIKNNYIQKTAIDKNVGWEFKDGNRTLEITINLSKPEKDNKEVAKLLSAPKDDTKYPLCFLCHENEGYRGTLTHPARTNLRTFKMTLNGETWYMQYSPYAYFYQHCILFSENHVPMQMTRSTVEKLLDFIEYMPHYFIGSNSDLPIVGGSILNHEHFQGGLHQLPMHKAPNLRTFKHDDYPDVEIGQVDWYNSVIRVSGYNRNTLAEIAGAIIEGWKSYSCEQVGVIASEDGVRHNTCTTIARFLPDNRYSLDIILRNNRTDDQYPDGIFHAHPEYHNIKKEGIGLIEAMGMFILPARLKRQLGEISQVLCGKAGYDKELLCDPAHSLYVHRDMIANLISRHGIVRDENTANKLITEYVNDVCVHILENTAVFKDDAEGIAAFNGFLQSIGIK